MLYKCPGAGVRPGASRSGLGCGYSGVYGVGVGGDDSGPHQGRHCPTAKAGPGDKGPGVLGRSPVWSQHYRLEETTMVVRAMPCVITPHENNPVLYVTLPMRMTPGSYVTTPTILLRVTRCGH